MAEGRVPVPRCLGLPALPRPCWRRPPPSSDWPPHRRPGLPAPPSALDTHPPFPAAAGSGSGAEAPVVPTCPFGRGAGQRPRPPPRSVLGVRYSLPSLTCTPRWARRGSSPGSSASRKVDAAAPPGALLRLSSAEILARCVLRSSERRTSSSTRSELAPAAARQRSRRRHSSPAMAGTPRGEGTRWRRTRCTGTAQDGGAHWRRRLAMAASRCAGGPALLPAFRGA